MTLSLNTDKTAVAAVDIGTNSVRLSIVDADGRQLAREMQITRLGQAVDVTGELHPDAIARTTHVLETYRKLIEQHGARRVRATATSAARDARNRQVFFDAAQAALGVRPELLSGEEEAALSFQGATTGLARELGPFLVIDIGGGSTELVLGVTAPEAAVSMPLGAVRMTERYLKGDPPNTEELTACTADVRAVFADAIQRVPVVRARTVVGVAGTITSLAQLQLGLMRYAPELTHHSRIQLSDIEVLYTRLAALPTAQRRSILADPKRAEVCVAGALILRTLLVELDVREILVSERDLLDGLTASLRTP